MMDIQQLQVEDMQEQRQELDKQQDMNQHHQAVKKRRLQREDKKKSFHDRPSRWRDMGIDFGVFLDSQHQQDSKYKKQKGTCALAVFLQEMVEKYGEEEAACFVMSKEISDDIAKAGAFRNTARHKLVNFHKEALQAKWAKHKAPEYEPIFEDLRNLVVARHERNELTNMDTLLADWKFLAGKANMSLDTLDNSSFITKGRTFCERMNLDLGIYCTTAGTEVQKRERNKSLKRKDHHQEISNGYQVFFLLWCFVFQLSQHSLFSACVNYFRNGC